MDSIIKLIKNNKLTTIVIIVYIVLVLILGIIMNRFFAKNGKPIYGDRLKEVEKYPINEQTKRQEIEKDLLSNTKISSVEFQVRGRTLNFVIKVKNEVLRDDAKKIAEGVVKYFTADELKVYSIEVLVMKSDAKLKDFPINATKQYGRDSFSWTKDR